MKDPEQNRVSQNEEESSTRNDNKPSLSSRIATFWAIVKSITFVKTLGYSGGFVLALLVGYGISFPASAPFPMQIVLLMASLWASSLPFFYFYCLLFHTESECMLDRKERAGHWIILAIFSLVLWVIFYLLAVCAGLPMSQFIFPILCWVVYLVYLGFAIYLMHCSDEKIRGVRFQLVLPVLAATAIPFCAGNYLAGVELPSLLSILVLLAYIVVVFVVEFVANIELSKKYFVGVSLLLFALVVLGTVFSQYVPSLAGEMSTILFTSILIAAISAVFESWRIAELKKKEDDVKRGDYFLSSSLALVAAVLLFPLIFLAGSFSNLAYYGVPIFLLVCMAVWCVCFERWNGKWKRIKTRVGFFFLGFLFCDLLVIGELTPADATLLYSSQNSESLALVIALFGLYWNQVIGSINKAKYEEPSLMRKAWRVFFRDRVNYFRTIGCLSSMIFVLMYFVRNLLRLGAVGAVDVFDLMGAYVFIALTCAAFDFVLVFLVSENTLKGVKKGNLMKEVEK